MRKLILIIVFGTLLFTQNAKGQHFYCRNYTINDGLPDNKINTLYQDSRGFLWIGTSAGIAKFDGNKFEIKTSIDGLAGDNVVAITEDNNGNIWFGFNDGGISSFNGHKINTYTKKEGLISNKITTLKFLKKSNILCIGTEYGLTIYDGKKFTSFPKNKNLPKQRFLVTSFLKNNNSIYVFTDGRGLYQLNTDQNLLEQMPVTNDLFLRSVTATHVSSNKDTIISINNTGFKFVGKEKKFINDTIGHIYDFTEDAEKNIWIAVNNNFKNSGGLYLFDGKNMTNYNSSLDIKSHDIRTLAFDQKENILWIGTANNGLFLYPKHNFYYYKQEDFNLNEFEFNDMLLDDKKHLWFTTQKDAVEVLPDGSFNVYPFELFENRFNQFVNNEIKIKYYYLNDPTGSFDKYDRLIKNSKYPYPNPYLTTENNEEKAIPATSLYKPLKYDVLIQKKLNELNAIKKDRYGNIWVGTNVGVFKILKESNTIKYFDLEGIDISNFVFGPKNELIVTSWNDLFIYHDIEDKRSRKIYNYFDGITPVNIKRIKKIDDKIWFISESNGIFLYDNGSFQSFFNSDETYNSFNDLCFDQNGNIILGGKNGIIQISELINDTIVNRLILSKKNNLLGTSIRWLNCTNDNYLIAGTNSGINIIDLSQLYQKGEITLKKIGKNQGFTDFSGKISAITDDNHLWIGTHNHLIKGNINNILDSPYHEYSLYIKSIEVNNESINHSQDTIIDKWSGIPKTKLIFPSNRNSISFNFDVIRFLDYDNIAYSYKLEGSSQDWTEITKERRAVFQNLKPGDYRFRIKAINTTNQSNSHELAINFTIKRPYWSRWWFYIPASIMIILFIWFIIFLRTKNIKKRERHLTEISERIAEFEMKALRAQMNPHFIFNAINSIQNYMLDNDIDSALGYLSDFAKLIRITLENVSKRNITLDEELNYLKYYLNLEKMRFDKKFEVEFILPPELEQRKIEIPPMVIQPFVENAIKHGFIYNKDDAKLKLEFKFIKENILKCIIEDNGIGRKKSRELNRNNNKSHQSKGTFITHERLSLLNQTQPKKGYKINTIDLYDEYNLPCGTRVEITLPV